MMVMPNHFHCIIENLATYTNHLTSCNDPGTDTHVTGTDAHVGASLRGRPDSQHAHPDTSRVNPDPQNENMFGIHNKKYGATIGEALNWFKTMTTNEYIRGVKQHGWPRFNGKLWQRDYYERIIRDEKAYQTFSSYIFDNPAKWEKDKFYFL
jgi:REP element-mobilizing transposase RayT